MTFTSLESVSKDQVENKDEAKDHGRYDDVGPVAPMPCNFLKPCSTHLESMSCVVDAFALLFHRI